MTQMLHNTKRFSRPSDSQKLGLAAGICAIVLTGSDEWYEVPGAGGEKSMREADK